MIPKIKTILLLSLILMIPAIALAQEEEVPSEDIPISFSESHVAIVLVGSLGGLTSAYLGSRKAKAKEGEKYTFNIHRFLDRVILAVIASIGLAIAAASGFMELNIVTLFLIFVASLGTSQLALQIRNRAKGS